MSVVDRQFVDVRFFVGLDGAMEPVRAIPRRQSTNCQAHRTSTIRQTGSTADALGAAARRDLRSCRATGGSTRACGVTEPATVA